MEFLKKIGRGIVSAGKTVTKELNKQIENSKRKNARWKGYVALKKDILKNKPLSELKKICKDYFGSEPSLYYRDPIDGRKIKKENPRGVYQNYIIKNISLDSLIDYAKKKRMGVLEIIKKKKRIDEEFEKNNPFSSDNKSTHNDEEFESKGEDDFKIVLNTINGFDPERVRDEKDLENQLKQWLKAKLENRNIRTQYKTSNGDIDIVIDDKYGIELKLVESVKILENLFGQVRKYIKELGKDNLAVVLMIDKKIPLKSVEEWTEEYESMGARVLVLENGNIKRKNRKIQTFKLIK